MTAPLDRPPGPPRPPLPGPPRPVVSWSGPALPGLLRPAVEHRPRWGLAAVLFLVTLATTTTLGAVWTLWTSTTEASDLFPILTPATVVAVWSDPRILALGLSFSLPALAILGCHEAGHYLACRHYRLPSTVPYFLPLPVALGTLGAFLRIRAPITSKRVLFDVGVAGPLAGFVALIPVLLAGVAWSEPVPLAEVAEVSPGGALIVLGDSLALQGATLLFHGPLPADQVLQLHPFALAAWFGLLATALNLVPLGQLDGGHVLYAAVGRLQRRLALPIWLALAAFSILWPGWLLWCLITLVMGLRHPRVWDEEAELGRGRRLLAWAALGVLVLSFMPVPLDEIPL